MFQSKTFGALCLALRAMHFYKSAQCGNFVGKDRCMCKIGRGLGVTPKMTSTELKCTGICLWLSHLW